MVIKRIINFFSGGAASEEVPPTPSGKESAPSGGGASPAKVERPDRDGERVRPSRPEGQKAKDLENFVDYIVRTLVDHPDEVHVSTEVSENRDLDVIRIDCNREDIGKIVGKRGRTIMAMRALVSNAAGRNQRKVTVEVND
jgi:predicted RNA-binding protein YlqC (UPF0109 family)